MNLKKRMYKVLYKHPHVKYCSQTIYETLLGCIRMYETTGLSVWQARASKVLNILIKIQRPDGGWDIGYDFNFGMFHRKGESTSPELIGLMALCEYARVFEEHDLIRTHADKAVTWIKRFAYLQSDDAWAIPYSPYTTSEIMVYNGTSFACGALGCYLGIFDVKDEFLHEVYHGMIKYLYSNLSSIDGVDGKFWYYSIPSKTSLEDNKLRKVDYYHQMQQVEMHASAQHWVSDPIQQRMIEECCDHIIAISCYNKVIPYTNTGSEFENIHVWGLCSVSSGLIEAYKHLNLKRQQYKKLSDKTISWLIKYSWNGEYFIPILDKDGRLVNEDAYMVRSDAWIFNALCCFYHENQKKDDIYNVIDMCFSRMESFDFSGKENHASSFRKRIIAFLIGLIKKTK